MWKILNRLLHRPCPVTRDAYWQESRKRLIGLPDFSERTEAELVCPHCGAVLQTNWKKTDEDPFFPTARTVAECPSCSYWTEVRIQIRRGQPVYSFGA